MALLTSTEKNNKHLITFNAESKTMSKSIVRLDSLNVAKIKALFPLEIEGITIAAHSKIHELIGETKTIAEMQDVVIIDLAAECNNVMNENSEKRQFTCTSIEEHSRPFWKEETKKNAPNGSLKGIAPDEYRDAIKYSFNCPLTNAKLDVIVANQNDNDKFLRSFTEGDMVKFSMNSADLAKDGQTFLHALWVRPLV